MCGVCLDICPGHKFDNLEESVLQRGGKGEAFEHAQNMLYNSSCMVLGFRVFSM